MNIAKPLRVIPSSLNPFHYFLCRTPLSFVVPFSSYIPSHSLRTYHITNICLFKCFILPPSLYICRSSNPPPLLASSFRPSLFLPSFLLLLLLPAGRAGYAPAALVDTPARLLPYTGAEQKTIGKRVQARSPMLSHSIDVQGGAGRGLEGRGGRLEEKRSK